MIPVNASGAPIGEIPFVRSGLLGFVGPVREGQCHFSCVKIRAVNVNVLK